MDSKDIYVLIGVDTETDVGSNTPYYEGVKYGTPKLLDLFEKKNVKATFYVTGDCVKKNPDMVKRIYDSGNEVGAHSLLHETVGDPLFALPGDNPLLPHEVEPRLRMNTEWLEEVTGEKPVSFRSPRLMGSTHVINALENLGYTSDASYPMYYYREQFEPYYPSRDDWTKKGDSTVLEIPNFADMTMESNDPGLERDRDQWPLFRTEGAEALIQKIDNYLDFCEENGYAKFLCFYIHPWEFHPMKSEYSFGETTVIPYEFITKNCGDFALAEWEKVIDNLLERNAKFVTASETAEMYNKNEGNNND
ncbi:MAG: polysaccharide deacetylase family protein [Clostridiaceae bacterium]|jgi:peptidoglycan/xylan/chitin deacetylase (PgdA/CDA1 family)|nr:polysaccharide deacetylase family protein [Bacillota bacterium]NLN52371.1 polysaccharide deacetylase family protein [Clostridiaceae bacterium]